MVWPINRPGLDYPSVTGLLLITTSLFHGPCSKDFEDLAARRLLTPVPRFGCSRPCAQSTCHISKAEDIWMPHSG